MKQSPFSRIIKFILIAFFILVVICPLIRMLAYITPEDFTKTIQSPTFFSSLKNSLLVSLCAMMISTILALLLALCMTRTNIPGKGILSVLFILPMLIPSISHGVGLVILFGTNGIITNLLHSSQSIYGFWGVVIGSVMYSFPVAYLMIYDVLRREDSTVYEAAQVLGFSRIRQFFAITLPYLTKPLISVLFAVFSLVITDYGVPIMVGGTDCKTLSVLMYEDVIGQLDFGKGASIGLVLLLPAVLAFLFDTLNRDHTSSSFVTHSYHPGKDKFRDSISSIFCALVCVFVTLPIIAFCFIAVIRKYPSDYSFSLEHIARAFQMNAGSYLLNSLIISLFTALVGVFIAYLCAYFSSREKGPLSKSVHLLSIISMAIPGLVLGLSFVLFFKNSFIYGTLAILILVNIIHFFSSPYLMMYNSFNKFNKNLEAVGDTLGISRFRLICNVFLPQSLNTIIEMFTYFFANSMMTISAVSFLSNSTTKPLSLLINQFEAQSMTECIAFVSIMILAVNLALKLIFYIIHKIQKSYKNRKEENELVFNKTAV